MEGNQGRGEIPSFKNVVAGKSSGGGTHGLQQENVQTTPVLGSRWQARMGGRCLPRAQKKPRYVIPNNKLEDYRYYMKDHALICKFIGFWPSERDLSKWIQLRWKPKGHIDLKLGAKGFFTVIFANLEDKERIFEEGPYFMNNAGLFMRDWEDRYNPDAEKLLAAPIWVRFFGLPSEFWHPEVLEGIGNSIRAFVKVAESTKRGKYTSYARICVYMNIAEPLLEFVEVEYHDEIWQQPIDYEHIPFRCCRCHEYGHLFREFPQNREGEATRILEEEKRVLEKFREDKNHDQKEYEGNQRKSLYQLKTRISSRSFRMRKRKRKKGKGWRKKMKMSPWRS